MDAVRVSDNSLVSMKRISCRVHPHEVEISLFFSSEPLASHPRNRCVPIYDVLDVPDLDDEVLLVLPLLREFDDPRIKSVGEAVEFFRQLFEVWLCLTRLGHFVQVLISVSLRHCSSCTNVMSHIGPFFRLECAWIGILIFLSSKGIAKVLTL